IGFTFNYFGNNYSTCIISQNGYIKFNTAQANGFSAWAIGQAIPGNPNVLNSIMAFYSDILPGTTGTVDYATVGTAPFRKFVVSFCDASMFSCTALKTSFQIILYETTNEIEIHLANVPNCPGWNSGAGIEGIQDNTGATAFWVAGRNYPTQWTAFQDAHRFTPVSSSNYSITPIPYSPVPNAAATISWYANGVTPVGTGTTVTVTPSVNTFYVAMATVCQDTLRDTVNVTMGGGPTIDSFAKADPTTCGGSDGQIILFGLDSNFLYTLNYTFNGTAVSLPVTSTINGTVTMVNLPAGVYDSLIIYKGQCFSNKVGPIILTHPPVIAAFTYDLHLGCEADTVFFTNSSIQNTFNIWDFGDGTGDTSLSPTHIYPIQGVYNVKLVVSNGICKDSSIQSISTLHPITAAFVVDDDSACANQVLSFTNTSTATGPVYFWDFGDSTTSTDVNPIHSYANPGSYTVMMVVTDVVPCSDTAYMTILVDTIPYISFVTSDSVLCEGGAVTYLGDYLRTGNTGIEWDFGDGNLMPNKDQVLHAYDSAGIFSVSLTASYRNCPNETFRKDIFIKPYPSIDLGPDTSMCPNGQPMAIGDYKNAGSGATWIWNTGETSPQIAVRHPGIYTARVSLDGCENSDSIEVFKDCYLDIPNSFTPNGDGINDYFLPRQLLSKGVTGFKMSVYNRWGQIIFETTKIDGRGWDGNFNDKEQPTGVYVYIIDAFMKDGNREHYQGNVTLLR
ncbi:MAG: PKD domain-containing protein, partial [Sphingobacteriales bacterium]